MKNLRTGTAKFDTIRAKDANGLSIQDDGGNGLFIKDGGNVGIGTTNPTSKLFIRNDVDYSLSSYESDSTLTLNNETDGDSAALIFHGDSSSGSSLRAGIVGGNIGLGLYGDIASKGSSDTPNVIINRSGNVGIGTNNPQSRKLNIHGDSTSTVSVASITRNQASAANNTYTLQVDSSSHVSNLTSAGAMSVDVNSGRAFTINGFGRVGIGTSNPTNRLHIKGNDFDSSSLKLNRTSATPSTNNDPGILLQADAGANNGFGLGAIYFSNSLDGNTYAKIRAKTDDATGASGRLEFTASTGAIVNASDPSMVIKSSGNVGIGTTNPSARLHIKAASGANTNEMLRFQKADGYGVTTFSQYYTNSSQYGLYIGNASNTIMTLKSPDGNVGIGNTNPALSLHVVSAASTGAAKIHSDTNSSATITMSVVGGKDSPSVNGDCKWIRLADGDDGGKSYIQYKTTSPFAEFVAISDERLKTNIQNTDVIGLDVINNLRLVKFDWDETAARDAGWSVTGHQKLGFIAQEVEQILPEFISEDVSGFKTMGESGFIPYLIKAIQEQQSIIEHLKSQNTSLESRISALES